MKKLIIIIFILMIFPIVSSYYICQDETDPNDIPCQMITPVNTNCTSNMSLMNLNDSIQYNYTMTTVGDGTCNATFNFSDLGYSYGIVVLLDDYTNSSATLNVKSAEDPDINLWLFIFIIFFLFLIFGIIYHDRYIGDILLFVAGCEMLIVGLWVFNEGISVYTISQWWLYPFAWILTGLGIILIFYASFNMINKEDNF